MLSMHDGGRMSLCLGRVRLSFRDKGDLALDSEDVPGDNQLGKKDGGGRSSQRTYDAQHSMLYMHLDP